MTVPAAVRTTGTNCESLALSTAGSSAWGAGTDGPAVAVDPSSPVIAKKRNEPLTGWPSS